MKKTNPHIGSSFEDFLREEGIHEEVEQLATKKLIALQLQEQMQVAKLSKSPWRSAWKQADRSLIEYSIQKTMR